MKSVLDPLDNFLNVTSHLEITTLLLYSILLLLYIFGWLHANQSEGQNFFLDMLKVFQAPLGKIQQLLVPTRQITAECSCLSWLTLYWDWEKFFIYQLDLDRRAETFER